MNWEGLCGTPWQMVAPEYKTKKELDLHCQGLWWKEFQRPSPKDSSCCLLTPRLAVPQEVVRAVQRWYRMEE